MRKEILVAAVLALLLAVASAVEFDVPTLTHFKDFAERHGKLYASFKEFQHRYSVFAENLKKIEHLSKTETSATFGLTEHADLTHEEFSARFLSRPMTKNTAWPVVRDIDTSNIPDAVDWRTKGAVSPVKNQGGCGSCWAFSTTGNVESQWFLAGHPMVTLSEQALVDCDHECTMFEGHEECDAGCNGGLMPSAYEWIIKNGGISSEADYPYEGRDAKCRFNNQTVAAKVSSWTMVDEDEDKIAAYLAEHGPLSIAVNASPWQFYTGGVFTGNCAGEMNHGVLLVGYGEEKDTRTNTMVKYWLIKNSWGTSWGDHGYIKVQRGVGKCSIGSYVCTAII